MAERQGIRTLDTVARTPHRERHHRRTFQTFFLTVLLISLADPIPSLRLRTVAFESE
jgi:hypothetical protein